MRLLRLLLLIVCIVPWRTGNGQAIHPAVAPHASTPHSAHYLNVARDADSPQIGVLYLQQDAFSDDDNSEEAETVQYWEYFLVGLGLPYKIVSDSAFEATTLDSLQLLIIPSSGSLSAGQVEAIDSYLQAGGGMIVSGAVSRLDAESGVSEDTLLEKLLAAEQVQMLDENATGVFQRIQGAHPITASIPPGFMLNIARPASSWVLRANEGHSLGQLVLNGVDEPATLIATNTYGEGRVVWFGFEPQDVASDEDQQQAYQILALNAIADVTRSVRASVRRWPYGYDSASAIAQLPSAGYRPLSYRTSADLLLRALERSPVEATFFLVARYAEDHPDILERMAAQGELGLVADTERPLERLALEVQRDRIDGAKQFVESTAEVSVRGIYPPGALYDANTLRVLVDQGFDYLVSGRADVLVPQFVPWEKELDYRDTLFAYVASRDEKSGTDNGISERRALLEYHPSLFSYQLESIQPTAAVADSLSSSARIIPWENALREGFQSVHDVGGLFLFAYEPEFMGLSAQRADMLANFGDFLQDQPTWSATLGEIGHWWKARQAVTIRIDSLKADEFTLHLSNRNPRVIEGVSLDIRAPGILEFISELTSSSMEASYRVNDDLLRVEIDRLPPGSHVLRWHLRNPLSDKLSPDPPGQ